MLGTRHEEYIRFKEGLPFLLQNEISRSYVNYSKESNWHDNIEIQMCISGQGFVLLDAEKYEIAENDMVVANSDVIHYTGTETGLTYSCLIISTEFCRNIGLDPRSVLFEPIVKSPVASSLFKELKELYRDRSAPYRMAKLNRVLIDLLLELAENHSVPVGASDTNSAKNKVIKSVILYTRQNYNRRITLDEIAKAVLYDKYALCREYKKYTGQTIIDDLNHYRCIKAMELLGAGHSVADAAALCGFDNLSYFGKTFKKHIGCSPSYYKKRAER